MELVLSSETLERLNLFCKLTNLDPDFFVNDALNQFSNSDIESMKKIQVSIKDMSEKEIYEFFNSELF